MADFNSLATSYVLADDEDEQRRLAGKAADEIRNAPRRSAAVLSWAQSINQWMPSSGGDALDGDVVVRAKALSFLAATLEVLDKDLLRAEQIERLVAFFGAMFAIDHKTGILPAATALRCLCAMAHFRPATSIDVLAHVIKLGDDFRLQAPATRRAVYDLLGLLVRSDAALRSLVQASGAGGQFVTDLLHLCSHERDPDNLLRWFAILRRVLERYTDPPLVADVATSVFKAASDYFPISMRSSTTPAGTTVDALKAGLRGVFAASAPVAAAVFDFLLQKMDQGDALTLSVKVDILSTVHACVLAFPDPATTIVPHTSRIWNSLKYEVRHGDVFESIRGTLDVIQAISSRLSSEESFTSGAALADFVSLVLADCVSDLANSTFTTPAGQLLNSTMRGGPRAYDLVVSSVLGAVKKDLQQAQTANHTRDLVGVLNDVLRTRQALVEEAGSEAGGSGVADKFHSHDTAIFALLGTVYLRLWDNTLKEGSASTQGQDPVVLNKVIQGLGELVVQRGPAASSGDDAAAPAPHPLLCSADQSMKVFETLTPRVLTSLPRTAREGLSQTETQAIAHEAMMALRRATGVFPDGFAYVVDKTVALIRSNYGASVSLSFLAFSPESLVLLRDALSRIAYIGCSAIPDAGSSQAVAHFSTLTQALHKTLEELLSTNAPFQVSSAILAGIYGAALNLRYAFAERGILAPVDRVNAPQALDEALLQLFQTYCDAALLLVQRLYLRATAVTSAVDSTQQLELGTDFALPISPSTAASVVGNQDRYLHQLASFATFVVRDLDEAQQRDAALAVSALNLFRADYAGPPSFFHNAQGGRTDVLSLGILRGLWPSAMASLADLDVSPLNLLDDFDALDSLPPRTRLVRNAIATSVANKYSAAASAGLSKARYPSNQAIWQTTVATIKVRLQDTSSLTPARFTRLVAVAAGAFARMDKDARALAGLLVFAPSSRVAAATTSATDSAPRVSSLQAAQQMARTLGGLLASDRALTTDDHAVVKSIYKQWVYSQTVKVLLPLAFSQHKEDFSGSNGTNGDDSAAAAVAAAAAAAMHKATSDVYTVSILALVRGMPFAVYEDDVAVLVRVLVAAASTLAPQWGDVAVALRVLSAIVEADRADAVRSHLKSVIDAAIRVFAASSRASHTTPVSPGPPPASRKEALLLVSGLPAHYEPGLLLPYEPRLARALAAACGDPVREIREVAQQARENWTKVAA